MQMVITDRTCQVYRIVTVLYLHTLVCPDVMIAMIQYSPMKCFRSSTRMHVHYRAKQNVNRHGTAAQCGQQGFHAAAPSPRKVMFARGS